MPGPLKRFKNDPNGAGRGGGLYYHRGHGIWSKYSWSRDAKRKKGRKVKRKAGYGHTMDSHYTKRRVRIGKRKVKGRV